RSGRAEAGRALGPALDLGDEAVGDQSIGRGDGGAAGFGAPPPRALRRQARTHAPVAPRRDARGVPGARRGAHHLGAALPGGALEPPDGGIRPHAEHRLLLAALRTVAPPDPARDPEAAALRPSGHRRERRPAGRLPLDLPLPASLPEREGVLVPELVVLHRPQHAAEAPAQRPPQ